MVLELALELAARLRARGICEAAWEVIQIYPDDVARVVLDAHIVQSRLSNNAISTLASSIVDSEAIVEKLKRISGGSGAWQGGTAQVSLDGITHVTFTQRKLLLR
jgi:hypothetical protein